MIDPTTIFNTKNELDPGNVIDYAHFAYSLVPK